MGFRFLCLVAALASGLGVAAAQQRQPTDRDLEGLVGPVKRVEEEEAEGREEAGRLVERGRHPTRSVTFDKQGRMVARRATGLGPEAREQTFFYEKQKRYTRYSLTLPVPPVMSKPRTFERLSVAVIRYDEAERALHVEVYRDEDPTPRALTQKYRYVFDAEGRLAESVLYTPGGRPGLRAVYTYGAGRHPEGARHYAASDPAPEVTRYTYTLDARGNWTKRVADTTLADGKGTRRIRVTYRHLGYH